MSAHGESAIETPARHQEGAVSTSRQLAWKWVREGKPHMPLLFLSHFGRHLITRKYDAFTTDLAYENRARGSFLVGKALDRYVLNQSLHTGLRQRLEIVVEELAAAISDAASHGPVTVVSGPSGLTRDLIGANERLRRDGLGAAIRWVAVDLDHSDEVLVEARKRCLVAGIDLATHRADLLSGSLGQVLGSTQASVFNCIGLTPWLGLEDVERLLASIASVVRPGGWLVVDNFHQHAESRYGDMFEMVTRYHPDPAFEAAIRGAGFEIVSTRPTANDVNVVYRARRR